MNVIVTDAGFAPAEPVRFVGIEMLADAGANGLALDLPSDLDPERLAGLAGDLGRIALVRITFGGLADGRGFTQARELRLRGYRGRLRAAGYLIADQYAMARRSGFDEVEIDALLAERQPQRHWQARSDWRAHDYQARLGRRPAGG